MPILVSRLSLYSVLCSVMQFAPLIQFYTLYASHYLSGTPPDDFFSSHFFTRTSARLKKTSISRSYCRIDRFCVKFSINIKSTFSTLHSVVCIRWPSFHRKSSRCGRLNCSCRKLLTKVIHKIENGFTRFSNSDLVDEMTLLFISGKLMNK